MFLLKGPVPERQVLPKKGYSQRRMVSWVCGVFWESCPLPTKSRLPKFPYIPRKLTRKSHFPSSWTSSFLGYCSAQQFFLFRPSTQGGRNPPSARPKTETLTLVLESPLGAPLAPRAERARFEFKFGFGFNMGMSFF